MKAEVAKPRNFRGRRRASASPGPQRARYGHSPPPATQADKEGGANHSPRAVTQQREETRFSNYRGSAPQQQPVRRASKSPRRGTKGSKKPPLSPNSPLSPPTPSATVSTGPGSKYHDCIAQQEWDVLEKRLQKYNGKKYQRRQKQAERKQMSRRMSAPHVIDAAIDQGKDNQDGGIQSRRSTSRSPVRGRPKSPIMGRSKSPGKGRPRLAAKGRQRSLLQLFRSGRIVDQEEEEQQQMTAVVQSASPLLTRDDDGKTPLHLSLAGAPERLIFQLVQLEPEAAAFADSIHGQLPLHIAITQFLSSQKSASEGRDVFPSKGLLQVLIEANMGGLNKKDKLTERSPMGMLIHHASERRKHRIMATRKGHPDASPETTTLGTAVEGESSLPQTVAWDEIPDGSNSVQSDDMYQAEQKRIWGMLSFLITQLKGAKRRISEDNWGLFVEVLQGGAPPAVARALLEAMGSRDIDDDVLGNALIVCMDLQYPFDMLEKILARCSKDQMATIIAGYLPKAMAVHYAKGCQKRGPGIRALGREIIDCTRRKDEKTGEVTRTELDLELTSPACQIWWKTLRHLLFFAAYGPSYRKNKAIEACHLLHATLKVQNSQPSLIQLLLIVLPPGLQKLCPVERCLPVHLACTRWRYHDTLLAKDEDSKGGSVDKLMKHVLRLDRDQIKRRLQGRLPIHVALCAGQSWPLVKALVATDRMSLGMRDPVTKLFPFQLAAVKPPSKNQTMMIILRNQYTPSQWRNVTSIKKKEEVAKAKDVQSRRQLSTIFELLRKHPDAIKGKTLQRDPKKSVGIKGAGPVSLHYLNWVYSQQPNGWKVHPVRVKLLRDCIIKGYIAKPLKRWYNQLKSLIWEACSADVPKTDHYLLHAALYSPDTPPLVVELLIALYPMAARSSLPGTHTYPLHIAAGTVAYHRQAFEVAYSMDSMHLTLLAYNRAAKIASQDGRFPIHICLAKGKTWNEVGALANMAKSTLLMKDPMTQLVPFQQIAAFKATAPENSLRFASLLEKRTRHMYLDHLSSISRAALYRDLRKVHELQVLTSIFELLRLQPQSIQLQKASKPKLTRRRGANTLLDAASTHTKKEATVKEKFDSSMALVDFIDGMQQSTSSDCYSSAGWNSSMDLNNSNGLFLSRHEPKERAGFAVLVEGDEEDDSSVSI